MDRGGFIRGSGRAGLDRFPEQVDGEDLVECFTLTTVDLDFVMARRGRAARLATGLQIGALRLMGFVPEDLTSAPESVVVFVAGQVYADPGEHDQPWALFRSGCTWMKSEQIVRVGTTVLERAVMAARQRATERTYMVLASQLDSGTRQQLDGLLVVSCASW